MRRLSAACAALLLVVWVVPVFAVDVTGELVDLSCYTKDKVKNIGAAHRECAMMCAKMGMTAAVVTATGEVYLVGGDLAKDNNARLVRHMSHQVAVQGSLAIGNNGTKTILATSIKMVSP
jgi:hypothetical protein